MADNADARTTTGPDLIVRIDDRQVIRRATDGPFTIGRDRPPADFTVAHPAVSRRHLGISPSPRWHITDYASLNGVYIQGKRVEEDTQITDGMTIHLAAPDGIPVTFHYVDTPTNQASPSATPDQLAIAAEDRTEELAPHLRAALDYDEAVLALGTAIADITALPGIEDPHFPEQALELAGRLAQLEQTFTALIGAQECPEAATYLACVQVMHNGVVARATTPRRSRDDQL